MKLHEVKDCEFGIIEETCYFCGQSKVIGFNEHYTFCPECSAIYTFMIIQRKSCEHITDDTPIAERSPWYKEYREKPHILSNSYGTGQKCSVCSKHVLADGW